MKIRFTRSAEADLLSALAYIRKDKLSAALDLLDRIATQLRRLHRFPESGRKIPEFPDLPHREIIVEPFRFFYRIEGSIIWIVAVWHGARVPDRPRA
ncbi:MAG: type II toxin-antitoxin system RelE/ParE family toxin [Candidatus Aminicenantes bacterium]|nr:type II toxin-antitoxin system RelE/ParE family toxin [Candidatus Aminicenantes bacterium]